MLFVSYWYLLWPVNLLVILLRRLPTKEAEGEKIDFGKQLKERCIVLTEVFRTRANRRAKRLQSTRIYASQLTVVDLVCVDLFELYDMDNLLLRVGPAEVVA